MGTIPFINYTLLRTQRSIIWPHHRAPLL